MRYLTLTLVFFFLSVFFLLNSCQKETLIEPSNSFLAFLLDADDEIIKEAKQGESIDVNIHDEIHFKFTGSADRISIWVGDSTGNLSHDYQSYLQSGLDGSRHTGFLLIPSTDVSDYKYSYALPGTYQVTVVASNLEEMGGEFKRKNSVLTINVADANNEYTTFRSVSLSQLGVNYITKSFAAVINDETLNFLLPGKSDLSKAIATFSVAPGTKVYINDILQVSGVTTNDFTKPVSYKLVSPRGEQATYTVNIELAPIETTASILSYSIMETGAVAQINEEEKTIHFYLKYLPNKEGQLRYTALYTTSPNVYIANQRGQQQFSGETSNNYFLPTKYFVVSEDGKTINTYSVEVEIGPGLKDITIVGANPKPIPVINYARLSAELKVLKESNLSNIQLLLDIHPADATLTVVEEGGVVVDKPFENGVTPLNFSKSKSVKIKIDKDGDVVVYTINITVV